jgi:hypothetical protein
MAFSCISTGMCDIFTTVRANDMIVHDGVDLQDDATKELGDECILLGPRVRLKREALISRATVVLRSLGPRHQDAAYFLCTPGCAMVGCRQSTAA